VILYCNKDVHVGSPSIASVSGSFTFHFAVVLSRLGLSSSLSCTNKQTLRLCSRTVLYTHSFARSMRISYAPRVLSLCLSHVLAASAPCSFNFFSTLQRVSHSRTADQSFYICMSLSVI